MITHLQYAVLRITRGAKFSSRYIRSILKLKGLNLSYSTYCNLIQRLIRDKLLVKFEINGKNKYKTTDLGRLEMSNVEDFYKSWGLK